MPVTAPSAYPIINIAAYRFVSFDADDAARLRFLDICTQLALKGTILLSPEGINLFLAGTRTAVDTFLTWLKADPRFAQIEVKESGSPTQPFKRMLVKCKPELITMKHPLIKPELGRAPAVAPATLKRWLDSGVGACIVSRSTVCNVIGLPLKRWFARVHQRRVLMVDRTAIAGARLANAIRVKYLDLIAPL